MEPSHITKTIISCAVHVYALLGNNFQESVYQRCLSIELNKAGLATQKGRGQTICLDGMNIETSGADLIVEKAIIVELAKVPEIKQMHLLIARNFVMANNFENGLLLNFGGTELQYESIVPAHTGPDNV